jgi:hypothetical protein
MSIERKQFMIWLASMSAAARKLLLVAVAASVTYVAMSVAPVMSLAQQLAPLRPVPPTAVEPSRTPPPKTENKAGTSDQADSAIAAVIVKESRDAYYRTGHPCACPDDLMRNGRRCGKCLHSSRWCASAMFSYRCFAGNDPAVPSTGRAQLTSTKGW